MMDAELKDMFRQARSIAEESKRHAETPEGRLEELESLIDAAIEDSPEDTTGGDA